MTGFLLALAAFSATLAGGLFALKFRAGMHFILAFTAGVLLGVVSFDILPEVFGLAREQGLDATGAMIALVAGFLLFHGLEKFVLIHHGHEGDTRRIATPGWASCRLSPWSATASWTVSRSAWRSRFRQPSGSRLPSRS